MVVEALTFITGCRSSSHVGTSNSYTGIFEKESIASTTTPRAISRCNRMIGQLMFGFSLFQSFISLRGTSNTTSCAMLTLTVNAPRFGSILNSA